MQLTGSIFAMPVYERTMIKIIIFFFVILLNYVNAGTLTISSSTFSKIKTGEIGNLDLAFSTASTIPQDGKIVITLPGGFDTTGITITISSGIDGTIATTKTGQVVVIKFHQLLVQILVVQIEY